MQTNKTQASCLKLSYLFYKGIINISGQLGHRSAEIIYGSLLEISCIVTSGMNFNFSLFCVYGLTIQSDKGSITMLVEIKKEILLYDEK